MEAYGSIISERAAHVLEQHKTDDQSIAAARSFLFDMLAPTPERGDMQYRYEHSVRVSQIAGVVARAEGLPEKDLVIACLLHDVGYRECKCSEDFERHPFISADIASIYLENIGYPSDSAQEMVRGIALHSLSDHLPEDMTIFQMTVRDCDDIDRYDMIRTALLLGKCVDEKTNEEIIASCSRLIDLTNWALTLKRGTQTAQNMMNENCRKRITLAQEILAQAKKGF